LVTVNSTLAHIDTIAKGCLLLDTNFCQNTNSFCHLSDTIKVEITNDQLVPLTTTFPCYTIRKELHSLVCVTSLVYELDVEQTSQNFANGKVCKFITADNQNLAASTVCVDLQILS